jgi:hypothetical protein
MNQESQVKIRLIGPSEDKYGYVGTVGSLVPIYVIDSPYRRATYHMIEQGEGSPATYKFEGYDESILLPLAPVAPGQVVHFEGL